VTKPRFTISDFSVRQLLVSGFIFRLILPNFRPLLCRQFVLELYARVEHGPLQRISELGFHPRRRLCPGKLSEQRDHAASGQEASASRVDQLEEGPQNLVEARAIRLDDLVAGAFAHELDEEVEVFAGHVVGDCEYALQS